MEARIQVGLERAQSRALFAFGRAASPNQAKTGTDSHAIYQAPEADTSEANGARFRTVPSGGNLLPRVSLSANEKGERERDIVERAKEQLTQGFEPLSSRPGSGYRTRLGQLDIARPPSHRPD